MTDAVVFNGLNALDFHDVRFNVIRIPEVSFRVNQAQSIWDCTDQPGFSFFNFLTAEDSVYLSNIKLKSLAAAVVQVGLYDRYLRNFRRPQYLIGSTNGDSPLHVAVGKISFEEMVHNSMALSSPRPLVIADQPLLAGISLTEYGVYRLGEQGVEDVEVDRMDINKLVQRMIDDHNVQKFINIGPGNLLLNEIHQQLALSEVQILESIDLDPMLSWFWPGMKRSSEFALVAQA